jgi:PPE-repeat protein
VQTEQTIKQALALQNCFAEAPENHFVITTAFNRLGHYGLQQVGSLRPSAGWVTAAFSRLGHYGLQQVGSLRPSAAWLTAAFNRLGHYGLQQVGSLRPSACWVTLRASGRKKGRLATVWSTERETVNREGCYIGMIPVIGYVLGNTYMYKA